MAVHQAGAGIIIVRDGEVVEIPPDPEMYEGMDRKIYGGM